MTGIRHGLSQRWCGAAILLLLLVSGCAQRQPHRTAPREDPADLIYLVSFDSLGNVVRSVRALPPSAYRGGRPPRAGRAAGRGLPTPAKLHPDLIEWIRTRPPSDVVEVMVTFVDTVQIPRFPNPDVSQGRGAAVNRAVLDTAQMLIDTLRGRRAAQYMMDSLTIRNDHGGTVVETFWLAQAALVRIRLGQVVPLSGRASVLHVAPNRGAFAPDPGDSTVGAAQVQIGSRNWFVTGMAKTPWIALLDTGVETRHHLLFDPGSSPNTRLCLVANCATDPLPDLSSFPAGIECSTFDPTDGATSDGGDAYSEGHGTSTAAILVGNQRLGDDYEGLIPGALLDCIRVYKDRSLNKAAACLGMELALSRVNQVIIAEMDDTTGSELADVSLFADHAFQAGRAVIAANGNDGKMGPGVPARGPLVIGVGSFDMWSFPPVVEPNRSRGPTWDQRLKPDILAPTLTYTASNSLEGLHSYAATSGAAPYAAGVAATLQQWMAPATDPGQTYALMILAGDQVGPFDSYSPSGAGAMSLPPAARCAYGKVWLTRNDPSVEIAIPNELDYGGRRPWRLDAAAWWPEPMNTTGKVVDVHNDVDLLIESHTWFGFFSSILDRSDGENGVFERVRHQVAKTRWPWLPRIFLPRYTVRISAKTMRTEGQWVYWALATR